ncbi:TPA: hypothetical protein ACTUT5_001281 [Legionella anisa]|uniref:Uncharacterized protein n=1 Tax=Legionella anisa TaxID=28082 RepID=A0AAX0WUL1_9GAMM|nr:hypothetical protein [Legionella anisa]MBN5936899.1 hypothetical protein [Legionella anisa]PNL60709.1 hypothetical protein A6J39_005500 [Legionella anisa]UAK80540.1 hypothetical protein K8O89_05660 [Legionella anisa]
MANVSLQMFKKNTHFYGKQRSLESVTKARCFPFLVVKKKALALCFYSKKCKEINKVLKK